MKFNSQSFPYPILTPADAGNDYIDGSFECVLEFSEALSEDLQIELNYRCMLSVEEIFEEIETGKAEYALEINCPETLYRRVISLERRGVVHLDATELHGEVTFTPLVVAKGEIHNFKSEKFDLIREKILIKRSSWIGAKAVICPGVTIEECSFIKAGEIVKNAYR